MTCITNIYKKEYSEIPSIQSKKSVYYNLVKTVSNNLTYFGVEIIIKTDFNNSEKTLYNGISESESYVRNMIQFLYENSINPGNSLEIISDLVSELEYTS